MLLLGLLKVAARLTDVEFVDLVDVGLDAAHLHVCDITQGAGVLLPEMRSLHMPFEVLLPLKGLGTRLAIEGLEIEEVDLLCVPSQLARLSEHLAAAFTLETLRRSLLGGVG